MQYFGAFVYFLFIVLGCAFKLFYGAHSLRNDTHISIEFLIFFVFVFFLVIANAFRKKKRITKKASSDGNNSDEKLLDCIGNFARFCYYPTVQF